MPLQLDLFRNKEEELEEFCRQKGFFSSHDVNYYGTTHFFDSATRRIREWVRAGKVKHLSKDEATFRGFNTKCAVYEWIGNDQKNNN